MRSFIMPLLAYFSMCSFVFGQDTGNVPAVPNKTIGSEKVYQFQVTEFRMKKSQDIKMTPGQIVQAFDEMTANGDIEIIETMRLTALDGHPCVMKQKKSTAVTAGTVSTPFPNRAGQPGDRSAPRSGPPGEAGGGFVQRSLTYVNLGSTVQLTARESNGKTLVTLSYNATRLQGDALDDRMPDMMELSLETTLLLFPGKTTLAGGSNADSTVYLAISLK